MKNVKLNKKTVAILASIGVLIVAAIIIACLSGGSKSEKGKEEEKASTSVPTKKSEIKIVDVNSTSRPYAVMINNAPAARPLQSGLQDAYIVYEMIVEGGITRYMALFMDQNTERIGSVRSSRHYYIDYAMENDAIYIHHGASPQAYSDLSNLGVDRIEIDGSKTGWRDSSLNVAYEHTLFTSIEKLNSGLGSKRTERNKELLLNYSAKSLDLASIQDAKVANSVSIKYSGSTISSYQYDDVNKVYKRFVNGKEHTDYVTKEQYTFKNIITYQVANSTISGDNKGRQNLENIGSGKGYYISEGYAIPITWEKTSRSSQTIYKTMDGKELVVNDGNTFIQIQPSGQDLTIE